MMDCFQSVRNQFGVGSSTIRALVMQVVRTINSILLRRVIYLCNVDTIIAGFADLGFPSCVGEGVIGSTHIPIQAPDHWASLYTSQKEYFSMVLQAVADHWNQFTNICVGWSGKAHNAHVFRNSSMFHKLQAGTFVPDLTIRVGDVDIPVCMVRDAAFPLLHWLMRPYTGHLNPSQEQYSTRLSRDRMVMEGAFGHLKAWFRCLLTQLDLREHNILHVLVVVLKQCHEGSLQKQRQEVQQVRFHGECCGVCKGDQSLPVWYLLSLEEVGKGEEESET
nr:protein ALP1-like [Pelodiscus sinensis]|eukprot:XP_025040118.1 protein ALP1-like [Pelodiscus sinensis]